MYEKFTDRARKVMQLANQEAQRFNHEYIGTEHILLGLVQEGSGVAAHVLKNLDVDLDKARAKVMERLKSGPDMVVLGKLPQTPRARKVIEHAIEEARNLEHNYIGTEHLLLGLLREQHGIAGSLLTDLGVKLEDAREEVLGLLGVTADTEKLPSVGALAKDPNCGPTSLGSVTYIGKTVDFRSFQVSPDGQTVTIKDCAFGSQQTAGNDGIPMGAHLFLDKLAGEVGEVKNLVKQLTQRPVFPVLDRDTRWDAAKMLRVLADLVSYYVPGFKDKLSGARKLAAHLDEQFIGQWKRGQEVGWLDQIRDEGDEQCMRREQVRPDALTYFGITEPQAKEGFSPLKQLRQAIDIAEEIGKVRYKKMAQAASETEQERMQNASTPAEMITLEDNILVLKPGERCVIPGLPGTGELINKSGQTVHLNPGTPLSPSSLPISESEIARIKEEFEKEYCGAERRGLQKMQASPEGMWQTAAEAEDAGTLQQLQAPIPFDRVRVAIKHNVIMVSARTAPDAMTLDEGATLEGWANKHGLQIVWLPAGISHAGMTQPSSKTLIIGYSTNPNPVAEAAYPNADTPVLVQEAEEDSSDNTCEERVGDHSQGFDYDTPKEVAAAITESPVESEETCPQGHHKLEGVCRREYCGCHCPRCEKRCRGT